MGGLMKTPIVAPLVGRTPGAILSMIREGRVRPPGKDSSGHYVWGPEDVERLREALARDRRFKKHRQTAQAAAAS